MRDYNGKICGISARSLDLDYDPPLVEILAIRDGLLFALSQDCQKIIVESDFVLSYKCNYLRKPLTKMC